MYRKHEPVVQRFLKDVRFCDFAFWSDVQFYAVEQKGNKEEQDSLRCSLSAFQFEMFLCV